MAKLNRRTLYLLALLLLVGLLAAVWQVGGLRVVPEQRDLGYGDEARRNPLLAAQLLLQQRGHQVAYARDLDQLREWLPQGPATLIISASDHPAEWQIHLWRWVKRGGHLIVNVQGELDLASRKVHDPWLVHLNFSAQLHPERDASRWFAGSLIDNISRCQSKPLLNGQLAGTPLTISQRDWLWLRDHSGRASWQLGPAAHADMLQYQVGYGKVTLVSDLALWSNRNINCADHAFLLTQLVSPGQPVWLLYYADMPSLAQLAWRYGQQVLLLALLLLLSWLWLSSRRLGPLLPSPQPVRRGLLQHLSASVAFNWRHGLIGPYIHSVQQQILSRMERHHPGFARLTSAEQQQLLAQRCQLSPAQIALAWSQQPPKKPQQLLSTVQVLQQIRNML